ncbi:hypothetical protein XU18_3005 [Perkinsela sp. CCAP 1560/4]|nr:hypothetical protein XU18_3005 [Perkinsela sp. CCAP 1560/4]|eukprot:KNH06068.1 hypothetical protein XU18_3005 [Perkinsela sp. CCAP 1560/4]
MSETVSNLPCLLSVSRSEFYETQSLFSCMPLTEIQWYECSHDFLSALRRKRRKSESSTAAVEISPSSYWIQLNQLKLWESLMEIRYAKLDNMGLISNGVSWPSHVITVLRKACRYSTRVICTIMVWHPLLHLIYVDCLAWARRLTTDARMRMHLLVLAGHCFTIGGAFATFKHWRKSLRYALWLRQIGMKLGNQTILFQCDLYIGYAMLWRGNLRKAEEIFHRQAHAARSVLEEKQCRAAFEKLEDARCV